MRRESEHLGGVGPKLYLACSSQAQGVKSGYDGIVSIRVPQSVQCVQMFFEGRIRFVVRAVVALA